MDVYLRRIVCDKLYEKWFRIPLDGDEILRVHGESGSDTSREVSISSSTLGKCRIVLNNFKGVGDALSGKQIVKSRRVRGMILAAQSKAFKQENVLLVGSVMDEAHASRICLEESYACSKILLLAIQHEILSDNEMNHHDFITKFPDISKEWNSGDDQLRFRMDDLPSWFWQTLQKTLEDIMRACVINFGGSYHSIIRCAPFEALYGRKCRSPILWAEIGESSLIGT
ncbi:hypothetical protein Tco_0456258 [Tanacetum coccineum]